MTGGFCEGQCRGWLHGARRSDLTLVCSAVELQMLATQYQTPSPKLCLAPFFVPPPPDTSTPGFGERQHFMAIGNWRHAPNMDSARVRRSADRSTSARRLLLKHTE